MSRPLLAAVYTVLGVLAKLVVIVAEAVRFDLAVVVVVRAAETVAAVVADWTVAVVALDAVAAVVALLLRLASSDGVDIRLVGVEGRSEVIRSRRGVGMSVGVERIGVPPSNDVDAGR